MAAPRENVPNAAATAVRNNTRAVASLRSASPSKMTIARCGTPAFFTIAVAAASVGLMMAPNAAPQANPTPGMSQANTRPSTSAVPTTSATDSPEMAVNSRRNPIGGSETAAAYNSGGRRTSKTRSGWTTTSGTIGSTPMSRPAITRSKGSATPMRGPSTPAAATRANRATPHTSISSTGTSEGVVEEATAPLRSCPPRQPRTSRARGSFDSPRLGVPSRIDLTSRSPAWPHRTSPPNLVRSPRW